MERLVGAHGAGSGKHVGFLVVLDWNVCFDTRYVHLFRV